MHGAPDRVCCAAHVVGRDARLGHRAIVDERPFTADRRNRHTRPVTEVAEPGDTPRRLPIQIVVADDLERSRVTVIFRLLLAIPHLIVVALWGFAALAVSVIVWLALLFEGKAPRSLQGFIVSYLRYSVHVSAYLYLAAGPVSAVRRRRGVPDRRRDRAVRCASRGGGVAARLVLALPVLLLAAAVGGGSWFVNTSWVTSQDTGAGWSAGWSVGGLAATAAFLAWFASLARGRRPGGCATWSSTRSATRRRSSATCFSSPTAIRPRDPARIVPDAALPPHPVRLELDRPARAVAAHRLLPAPARRSRT